MNNKHLISISIILLAASLYLAFSDGYSRDIFSQGKRMQKIYSAKQETAQNIIQNLKNFDLKNTTSIIQQAKEEGITLLVYKKNDLLFWSDNSIQFNNFPLDSLLHYSIVIKANSKYNVITERNADTTFLALIKLEADYPYENKFLKNGIDPEYKVKSGAISVDSTLAGAFTIYNTDTSYAFSLFVNDDAQGKNELNSILASLLFIIGFFLLLVYCRQFLLRTRPEKLQDRIILVVIGVGLFRILLGAFNILDEHFYLFDPYIYASRLSPSLGDLVLNTMVLVFYSYLTYRFLRISIIPNETSFKKNVRITLLNLFYIIVFLYAFVISKGIISHSSISIIPEDISLISFPTLVAYVIFAINFFSVLLIGLAVNKNLKEEKHFRTFLNCAILMLLVFGIGDLLKFHMDPYSVGFGIALYFFIGTLKDQIYSSSFFSAAVIFLLLFSVFILFFTVYYSQEKEKQKDKTFAISLSNEHDPIAEYLLEGVSAKLMTDTSIMFMFYNQKFNALKLSNHLNDKYFGGYLKKFNVRITVCTPPDSVLIENPEYSWVPCYNYFNSIINDYGIRIPSTPFYYLDNYLGLVSYMGSIKYVMPDASELSLYIELESKFTNEQIGYPELLLDESLQNGISDFNIESSYAKYYKGNLISHSGKFNYSLRSTIFMKDTDETFYTVKRNGYNHLVYKPDKNNKIIISEKLYGPVELVVLFSYVFVFYYLLLLLIIFMLVSQYRQFSYNNSLRNKIQFSVISVLLVSLILIAGSTIWFNINKYNLTQIRNIQEKIQSVYVEVDHKFSSESELLPDWKTDRYDNLDQLLIKFSDVFYADINMYDPHGDLLATSRPEIFQLGLLSTKMDPIAYHTLHSDQLANFIHRERINKLSYLSAYVPYFNANGKLLAYINLPYFTRQKELQEDVTTLTVTILNIYVLLILFTIIVIVFISNQITKPLELIQARFRGLAMGGKYEKIKYTRQDEIGKLVNEYNNMVVELERNVELLARSERESAWREMAKQVAHEIKNPLTPMRLSVQQLKRAWDDKKENFDEQVNRVTNILIEQIDNLSAIASEFSNFAKMPETKIGHVELGAILEKTVSLFDNERVKVLLIPDYPKLFVKADSDQLSRVFINIIKNGIQAIPDEQDGLVSIKLSRIANDAIIEITDNGKGITNEIKAKMFSPNFTTKSSGMGLGLAIVKNILNQINARIEFKTEIGKGTTFKIFISVIETK